MKSVREISYFKKIREIREFQFGVFYYFDGLVISEMKEGVIFGWNMAEKAVKAAHEIFGEDTPIAYISNRINSYYVLPTDWIKFYKNKHQLSYYSVVGTTRGNYASVVLERFFFKNSIKQFSNIEDAVNWTLSKLNEQKVLA